MSLLFGTVDVIVVFISFCGMLAMAGMVCAPVAVEFDLDVDEEVDEQQDVELDADDDVHLVLLSIRMPFAGTM